jgi:biotin synthase-related radical SAM superfamily protein
MKMLLNLAIMICAISVSVRLGRKITTKLPIDWVGIAINAVEFWALVEVLRYVGGN